MIQVGQIVIEKFNRKRQGRIERLETCLISRTALFPFKTLAYVRLDEEDSEAALHGMDLPTLRSNYKIIAKVECDEENKTQATI